MLLLDPPRRCDGHFEKDMNGERTSQVVRLAPHAADTQLAMSKYGIHYKQGTYKGMTHPPL